jgi:hypothetical protein
MNPPTFAELYCTRHGLAPEDYVKAVFTRALYPHARLLQPILGLFSGYFVADRDFVYCIGRITRMRQFDQEAIAYVQDPNNRGFLRKGLRLRVSVSRMHHLVRATMREGSKQPFSGSVQTR